MPPADVMHHTPAPHHEHVDLLVIGWGKGGKTLAGQAGRAGKRVAVVEQSDLMVGGSCINIACVPTKALIHDAAARRPADDPGAWFTAAVARRDELTHAMRTRNHTLLAAVDSILLVSGTARFTGPREVVVTGVDDRIRLTADAVAINTGSRAALPDVPGAALGGRVFDSEGLQHASPLPRRLTVIGAGPVGLEFASMFAHFGSEVTVLCRGARPLRREDDDVAAVALAAVADAGVRLVTDATVTRIEQDDDVARVSHEAAAGGGVVESEAVLIAVGRRPWTHGLGLEEAGVAVDEHGWIRVDDQLRTTAPGVWALGDVHGGAQYTYTSLDDSRIVAGQLLGLGAAGPGRRLSDRVAVPSTLFLTPPLSRVGLTERAAREQGHDVRVAARAVGDIAAMPRPRIEGDARGIVKVVVDAATDQVLGAALMHVQSQEVINLVALAMRAGVPAAALRDGIWTHPSATEALNEVLGALR